MKFYRVHLTAEAGVSVGSEWFTSERAANARKAEWKRQNRGVSDADETADSKVEVFDIQPTRSGILKALNLYASHPDNG